MSRHWFALAVLVGLAAGPASAADPKPSAARTLTPEVVGFVHVRVGDLWTSDLAAPLRKFVAQAGPELTAAFEKQVVPSPGEIESLTVVLTSPDLRDLLPVGHPSGITPIWVVTTKKPYDRIELLKSLGKSTRTRKHGATQFFFEESKWAGLYLLDDRTFAYGSEDSITQLLDRMAADRDGTNPLQAVFTAGADRHPVLVGVNVASLAKPENLKNIPEELHPLLKAKTLAVALDLSGATKLTATLDFPTEVQAESGQKGAHAAVAFARKFVRQGQDFVEARIKGDGKPGNLAEFPQAAGLLLASAGLRQIDATLKDLPITLKGTTVQTSLVLDGIVPGGAITLSVVASVVATIYGVEEAGRADRAMTATPQRYEMENRERNLQQIVSALEKYHKAKGHYPPPYTVGKDGEPLLSWRVELLPYMEYAYIPTPYRSGLTIEGGGKALTAPELYKMFKHDEPWDGPNNKKLIERMPELFRAPWYVLPYNAYGKTTTLALVGKGAIFDPAGKVSLGDVKDGLDRTAILIALEDSAHATFWTKPADIHLTADGKWPADGPKLDRRFTLGYATGGARTFEKGLAEKTLLSLISRAGGEMIDPKEVLPLPPGKGPFDPKNAPAPVPDPEPKPVEKG